MGFTLDANDKPDYNNDITDPVGQFQGAVDYAERAVLAARQAIQAEYRSRFLSGTKGVTAGATVPPADAVIREYFFHAEPRTNASAAAEITLPVAFPTAVGGAWFNSEANAGANPVGNGGGYTRTSLKIVVPGAPNTDVRIGVHVWGW